MEILKTNNYEMFKLKEENREINFNKVNSLKSKLIDDGRQILPIVCDKDMNIIDGQHRFKALKELEWEVMYYIDENIKPQDLITINNTQKKWGAMDYIHYYATLGNQSYIKLEKLCKKYPYFPIRVILPATACGEYIDEKTLRDGQAQVSNENYENAVEVLDYLTSIKDGIRIKIAGGRTFFYLLTKIYYLPGIDREKLRNNVIARYGTENYGNGPQCAVVLEHFYNHRARDYRYISNEILPRR